MAYTSPYLPVAEPVRQQMAAIAACRDAGCPVVTRHPFYPLPHTAPFSGPQPCRAVVPTCLATGNLMIIGEYPNCRFGTVTRPDGHTRESQVAIGDIDQPFAPGRYFDGYAIRDYPTGATLRARYLDPLGLTLENDVWLTNVVKCFLFKPAQVAVYTRLGWNDPAAPQVQATHPGYAGVAAVCLAHHLVQEVALCQPKLILALGQNVFRALNPGSDEDWSALLGVPQPAGAPGHRLPPFDQYPLVYLSHPSRFLYEPGSFEEQHAQHMAAVRLFGEQLGITAKTPVG